LRQSLLATAFETFPYRNPVLGWPADVSTLRLVDAKAYLDRYCGPGNTVIAIVGDVDPASARSLAERYFGPIPAKPRTPQLQAQELPQGGPKTVALWSSAQPQLLIGYKRPPEMHGDDGALDALAAILGDRQTGWLRKQLVEEMQIAQDVEAVSDLPSARYVNLFVLSATPAKDHTVDENLKAIDEVVAGLQSKPVDAETLTRVKNSLRGRFLRLLGGNQELAALLPEFYCNYGDWRRLFTLGAVYDRLTAADIQRVAAQYLIPVGRTVAYLGSQPRPGNSSNAGGLQ
jgi:predicted Zn-dependent peptidase